MDFNKLKESVHANFMDFLNIFAQEGDFVNGDRRKRIHEKLVEQEKNGAFDDYPDTKKKDE